MFRRCSWLPLGLVLVATACDESAGPLAIQAARKSTRPASTETATTTGTTTEPTALRFLDGAPPLATYDTTFTVVQGTASLNEIYFVRKRADLDPVAFMQLSIPADAQFADSTGAPVPNGSTVRLTVHADSVYVRFEFSPHGSTFTSTPATLKVHYGHTNLAGGAEGDLKIWYQPDASTAWSALPTTVEVVNKKLRIRLDHFSNYRVAF